MKSKTIKEAKSLGAKIIGSGPTREFKVLRYAGEHCEMIAIARSGIIIETAPEAEGRGKQMIHQGF